MLGLMQLGGALRNWMPAKTQKTARSVRIGQQPAAGLLVDLAFGKCLFEFRKAERTNSRAF